MELLVAERAGHGRSQPRRSCRQDRSAHDQPPPDRKPCRRRRFRWPRLALGGHRRGRDHPFGRRHARGRAHPTGGRPVRRRPANVVPIRMPSGENWTLAQRMAAEKESFGFYFSAIGFDNYRLSPRPAPGASPTSPPAAPADGGRTPAVMAAWSRNPLAHLGDGAAATYGDLVRFRRSVRSDRIRTMRSPSRSPMRPRPAGCALLGVVARPPPGRGDAAVTIRSLQSFEGLARRSRCR